MELLLEITLPLKVVGFEEPAVICSGNVAVSSVS